MIFNSILGGGSDSIDLSSLDATVNDVLNGKKFIGSGSKEIQTGIYDPYSLGWPSGLYTSEQNTINGIFSTDSSMSTYLSINLDETPSQRLYPKFFGVYYTLKNPEDSNQSVDYDGLCFGSRHIALLSFGLIATRNPYEEEGYDGLGGVKTYRYFWSGYNTMWSRTIGEAGSISNEVIDYTYTNIDMNTSRYLSDTNVEAGYTLAFPINAGNKIQGNVLVLY